MWACVLFERYACLRPLHRVSTWMSDRGLPISVGTLADSVPRFLPLFEPFDEAIRAHQNEAAVRHGDETGWRVQSLSEAGRSSRAWLWTSVSDDAVYFHIDPSRSAKVAHQLFGAPACILFLVCDRLSTYKTMARELGGAVILCWCWAHQRRDFIHGAAGQVRLTHWCQRWIERIASIYRLNDARLEQYDLREREPRERRHQPAPAERPEPPAGFRVQATRRLELLVPFAASPRASSSDHSRSAPPDAAPQVGDKLSDSPRPEASGSMRTEPLAPHSL